MFDAPGRYVVAEDDEARWLVGEQTAAARARSRAPATGPRRLSAVGDDDELPLGEDAIGMVSDDPARGRRADRLRPMSATEDLTATAAAVRGTGDADWIATQASERPTPPARASRRARRAVRRAGPTAEPEPAAEPEPPRRPRRRGRRASVPSWDEIMFGGGKRE